MQRIPVHQGVLCHLLKKARPDLAKTIEKTQEIETIVVGLGRQGTRHAGLMKDFGTTVTAGIAPGQGGQRIHETIPVYDTVADCLEEHPNIAAASIWKHYTSARDATLEVIEAGIPMVVLISEFIPLRDVRDILVAARKHKTVLTGGNTPGSIFPPEGIKIGMLPDVFHPQEISPDRAGPAGVTILSRSGAILYHLSDGMASAGIAQNAVIGVGGDGAIGSPFPVLVPLVMEYEHTDLVVVAGEIGGIQEELLAVDMKANPKKYPKPLVAMISGNHAPEGKTMGHAGAIVSPGQEYGTYKSKRKALEEAGVTVVNSQYDLIEAAKKALKGKTYFEIPKYYERMRAKWAEPSKKSEWGTITTSIAPNKITISGYKLDEIIEHYSLLETAHLLIRTELPSPAVLAAHRKAAYQAAMLPPPPVKRYKGEDISQALARCLLMDKALWDVPQTGKDGPVNKTIFALGRFARYLAYLLGNEAVLKKAKKGERFAQLICRAVTGDKVVDPKRVQMVASMVTACVDHGVTAPSAQSCVLPASVRASYQMAVASGIGAITDIHGGAGTKAAEFFLKCVARSKEQGVDLVKATEAVIREYVKDGRRIEGLGHRVHTEDPRRNVLWKMAKENGLAGPCVEISQEITEIFERVRDMFLPINVDGVVGAIVADMGLDKDLAKALFVFGRVAGLSAHYFEEIASQPPMRQINFAEAVYKGRPVRPYPKG
jgi:succinyl-CoA synthetase alpha subunit